jgi:hypothetical protein
MNPRYRRLLIPGLLIALLVVVLVSSLVRRADGAESAPVVVSTIADPRITESSGLAVSVEHDDLAYTINDSGNAPVVYAIRISTGAVVGTTTISGGTLVDTEALAIDRRGTLWIGDTGDNDARRTDVAIYTLPEPGPGEHAVTARRHPITYQGGPVDVEALLVDPRTDAVTLVSKGLFGGSVYRLPRTLSTTRPNRAAPTGADVPALVTDGALTADGRHALLRTYATVHLYDAASWKLVRSHSTPPQKQGESLAIERSGRSFLLGSEGTASTLIRMPLTLPAKPTPRPSSSAGRTPAAAQPDSAEGDDGFAGTTWLWAIAGVGVLTVIAVAATRRG